MLHLFQREGKESYHLWGAVVSPPLSLSLSIHLSVCLSVCLFLFLSFSLSLSLSLFLSLSLPLSLCLSVSPSLLFFLFCTSMNMNNVSMVTYVQCESICQNMDPLKAFWNWICFSKPVLLFWYSSLQLWDLNKQANRKVLYPVRMCLLYKSSDLIDVCERQYVFCLCMLQDHHLMGGNCLVHTQKSIQSSLENIT